MDAIYILAYYKIKIIQIQYLILFNGVNLFGIQEIINRIRKEFYKKELPHQIIINLDCIEL